MLRKRWAGLCHGNEGWFGRGSPPSSQNYKLRVDPFAGGRSHKSTVIVTMIIWSRPWSAVVAPTSGKCSRMKGIYRRTVWCREGHVRASDHRIARADPEDRLLVRAVSRKNLPLGVKPLNAKRL